MATQRSVALHTLGCKLNFSETSSIQKLFEDQGYMVRSHKEPADIFILNTCSVTEFADKKCRYEIRKFKRLNPTSKVVVIGCYAQLKPKEISEIEGVNLVLGAAEKFRILEFMPDLYNQDISNTYFSQDISHTHTFHHAHSEEQRVRSFLKVQDGCDYKCSFCTIPLARGKSRSDRIDNILAEANRLAQLGTQEIVLTGVNIGDFGHGTSLESKDMRNRKENFLDLIKKLDSECPIPRIRISSIEPNLLSDEIIEFVSKSKRFMPHFHIPLQSGSDVVLKSMRRRYRTDLYRSRIMKIKECMPHACIGADVIVGYPTEDENAFKDTRQFIEELPLSYLHIFTFSERADTPAALMNPQVPMPVRKDRNSILHEISKAKKQAFYREHADTERWVLFENRDSEGIISGFTDNYIKIQSKEIPFMSNSLHKVKIAVNSEHAEAIE